MGSRGLVPLDQKSAVLAGCDAVISCVPTPLGTHLEPDLSYVERTSDEEQLEPVIPSAPEVVAPRSETSRASAGSCRPMKV